MFVTGDRLSTPTLEFLARSGAPSVAKPFAPDDVLHVVRQVLIR